MDRKRSNLIIIQVCGDVLIIQKMQKHRSFLEILTYQTALQWLVPQAPSWRRLLKNISNQLYSSVQKPDVCIRNKSSEACCCCSPALTRWVSEHQIESVIGSHPCARIYTGGRRELSWRAQSPQVPAVLSHQLSVISSGGGIPWSHGLWDAASRAQAAESRQPGRRWVFK